MIFNLLVLESSIIDLISFLSSIWNLEISIVFYLVFDASTSGGLLWSLGWVSAPGSS